MIEVWKSFQNWEISNLGNVRHTKTKRILKLRSRRDGYVDVKLSYKRFLVHRLVAICFLDNPEQKQQINHKDGIRANNKLSNLEWVNQSENVLHAFSLGLISRKGEKNSRAKLNEGLVKEIRKLIEAGIALSKIAKMFGMHHTSIRGIKNRSTWAHVV